MDHGIFIPTFGYMFLVLPRCPRIFRPILRSGYIQLVGAPSCFSWLKSDHQWDEVGLGFALRYTFTDTWFNLDKRFFDAWKKQKKHLLSNGGILMVIYHGKRYPIIFNQIQEF